MLNQNPLRIALGDLRHDTVSRHSVFIPIGVAYIASYILSKINAGDVEVRLYDKPGMMVKDIEQWRPDVVGLSNYSWNAELSRAVFNYAKGLYPETFCVAGGPEFPTEPSECRDYLRCRKEIDFYVYLEGEIAFSNLIKKILQGAGSAELRGTAQEGIMSVHLRTGALVAGEPAPRLKNLDEIPSPYLSGLLERYFDGHYAPAIETVRGCPFSCGYCHAGHPSYNSVTRFSTERIKAELNYIARYMTKYPNMMLGIFDTNFGIHKRDEDIAEYMRGLQDEFGWPNAFEVSTAKGNYGQILRMTSRLRYKMSVSTSLQSLNPKALGVINRKNPSMDEYRNILDEIKRRDMPTICELIVPLPEETRASFFAGIETVVNAGAEYIVPLTTMMLKGTYLNSQQCREKYEMQTRFRLIPKQFGEYAGQKCFEVEEVCVGTNTISFEDYLDCRGFGFISSLMFSEQFDLIKRHLSELGVNNYDYLYHVWELVLSGRTEFSKIYKEYIQETQEELWDSKDSVVDHFSKEAAYGKLLSGELGDNLIRKYKVKTLLECCIPTIELAYFALEGIAGEKITQDVRESLDAAKRWMMAVRNTGLLLDGVGVNDSEDLHLAYDVNAWYIAGDDSGNLLSYNSPSRYKIFYDTVELEKFLAEGEGLFGKDLSYQIGKLLVNWSVSRFWRTCKNTQTYGKKSLHC